ncbi:MAG: type II secretion system F family protein [Herminiimonas sp.]|nr:type II secretion system F family protein [Herminiimonas sp.]
MIATDSIDAKSQAEKLGYNVISLRKKFDLSFNIGSKRNFLIGLFTQELLALLEAGLSLVETVDVLSRKSRQPETKKILESLTRALREGQSFSSALESMSQTFPPLYVATIRTSEKTGDLPEALRRYLAYHQQLNLVRDKVLAASVYPILLMIVGVLVILFLLGYVVPRFSRVYEDVGGNLPWLSRMLMQWGRVFSEHAGWIAGAFFLFIGGVVYGLTRASTRARIERMFWAIPALGEKMRLYQLARFTRTLAMLINGGIPFVTALDMVRDLLHQPALLMGLRQAVQGIREGRSVSDAFAVNGLTTEVGVRLLAVGERSGDLGQAMERIAKLYDDEIARWVDWFARLFEPMLMIAIGLIIGVIVLLMYLPIFELASSIQ